MQYQGGKSRIARDIADIISIRGGDVGLRYQGGKSRIAKDVASRITPGGSDTFVSLFCGSCAVESKVKGFPRMILNDLHPYLIAMLKGVQRGYTLPDSISEDEYRFLRENPDLDPVLTGFVGFGCSFGGKWFGGYARNKGGTNYAAQSKKSLLKDMTGLQTAEFTCSDYRTVPIPAGATIYADPPYQGTTGYRTGRFDSGEFWNYMRLIAQTGHPLYISELTAPDDFECIWEKPFTRTLDRNKENQFKSTEKLFIYKGGTVG